MAYNYCSHTASCFFGWRNGKSIEPIEGVNYTQETLRYMTPPKRADEITNLILEKFQFDNITLWESNGGIGGNTLSFLDNARFRKVKTFEIVPERFQLLKNNIEAYGFDEQRYELVLGGFTPPSISNEREGEQSVQIVYMDPPWLSESEDPLTSQNYLLSGIKFGDKTLEQWLPLLANCPITAIRVPPGYNLKPMPGFEYTRINIKKSLLYLCRSTQAFGTLIDQILEVNVPPEVTKIVSAELLHTSQKEYITKLKRLQLFLFQKLLVPVIADPIIRLAYVSKEQMPIWTSAFTHKMFDFGKNYEKLEFRGDAILKQILTEQIDLRYPNLNEDELSNAKHFTEKEKSFAVIGKSLDLLKYAFLPIPAEQAHPKINEDLFEAFVGALYQVAENVQGVEAYSITSRIINYPSVKELLDNIDVGLNFITTMKNYMDAFGLGYYEKGNFYGAQGHKNPPSFVKGQQGKNPSSEGQLSTFVSIFTKKDFQSGRYVMDFVLFPSGIAKLQSLNQRLLHKPLTFPPNVPLRGLVLAHAEGQEKPTMDLMKRALEALESFGVGEELFQKAKDTKLKAKINEQENLWDSLIIAIKELYRNDVNDFEFSSSDKLVQTESVYVQLYGVSSKEGKSYTLLETMELPRSGKAKVNTEVKKLMIQKYLRRHGLQQLPELLKRYKNALVLSNEKERRVAIVQQPDPTKPKVQVLLSINLNPNETLIQGRERVLQEFLSKK